MCRNHKQLNRKTIMATINFHNTVTINELRTIIPAIGVELTPIIQSEPGCGKTSLLNMIREDLGDGYDYIYVDCPVKDMSDIGMVIPDHKTQTLEYYVASLFKMDSPKPKIILLDELMKASKMLQVIFTRMMLERMVGDRPLPTGSIVFGTSNNASDGVGDSMLAHAGNRVCILKMSKPTPNEWLAWASENKISRVIRAWVSMFPRSLASYTDGNQNDNPYIFKPASTNLSFCSPRSLAKADVIVRNVDLLGENATMCALAGTIGASAAGDMSAFLKIEKSLIPFKDILKDPTGVTLSDDIATQIMIMFQAIDNIESQDDLDSFMIFINRIKSQEVQAIFFTMVLKNSRTVRIASRNKSITNWASANHELF